MTRKLIGLIGFISSGKGTVGEYLVEQHGFKAASFAGSLKDAVSSIFKWPRHLLEGDSKESREWREITDIYWSRKLGKEVSPRWILQHIGTDVLRNYFSNNIWIWSLEKHLNELNENIVITDVRFPNEIEMITSIGGNILWVQRGEMPEWYDVAVSNKSLMPIKYPSIHSSEYEWLEHGEYKVVDNNSDLAYLYSQVDKCLTI